MRFKPLNQQPIETQRFLWKSSMLVSFMIIIALLGANLNFVAMRSNGMKMPSFWGTPDSTHTLFTNFNDPSVNVIYLTDIFAIHGYVYSIGDLMFYSYLPLSLIFLIWFIFGLRRQVWLRKD